jgi:SAM-dependent methyltransferase
MHPSALNNGRCFFQTFGPSISHSACLLEIGAFDVNGSWREVAPPVWEYVGVDFSAGPGIDVMLDSPYLLPFPDGSFDFAVSISCFEHYEMFWILFLEILRVLMPDGLLNLKAPTNGSFHRYPVDFWRFFPASGKALEKWEPSNSLFPGLHKSFVSHQQVNPCNVYGAFYVSDADCAPLYLKRTYTIGADVENIHSTLTGGELLKFSPMTEGLRRLRAFTKNPKKQIFPLEQLNIQVPRKKDWHHSNGDAAMHKAKQPENIRHYAAKLIRTMGLAKSISINVTLARTNYCGSRQFIENTVSPSAAKNLSIQLVGRAYAVATLSENIAYPNANYQL